MTFNYREFDIITVEAIRKVIDNDIFKYLEVYADHYFISFKTNYDIMQLFKLIEERETMKYVLDTCVKCLKLVEFTNEAGK